MLIFGKTRTTTCRFGFKQYNLFYTVQKHKSCSFMETMPHVKRILTTCKISSNRIWLFNFNQTKPIVQITTNSTKLKYICTRFKVCIWDQKVYFWNIPSDADIYWCNKINPLLLIALCLLSTLCCSFLLVYNSVLFIDECLKWDMHVRCEHQYVSDPGLPWCSYCCLNWCSMCENVTYWTCHLSPLNISITWWRSMLYIKTIPSIYGNGKQMKEYDNTSWL